MSEFREVLHVDEATLTPRPGADTQEPSEPAPRVTLPEPMLRYACNQQGCCCGGWRIPWRPDDLVRLGKVVTPEEKDRLTRDVELKVDFGPDGEREVQAVYVVDDEGDCRFLSPDRKQCGIHTNYGLAALPNICIDFPVAAYTAKGGVDFYFDPVCPSVLDALGESDAPLTITERAAPYADEGFALRASHTRGRPLARVGAKSLEVGEVDRIRRLVVESLADHARPVWQHLHAIDEAYGELARGEATADTFALRYDRDPGPYLRFLGQCIGAHGAGTLEAVFDHYRRFVYAVPTAPDAAAWDELGKHLREWQPAMEKWIESQDDLLRPLQLRYLAHRHFAPFLQIRGKLEFASGAIVHAFATSLRFAAALGAVFRRPVDREIMKVALGSAEYTYRSLEIPPDSLPWWGISA